MTIGLLEDYFEKRTVSPLPCSSNRFLWKKMKNRRRLLLVAITCLLAFSCNKKVTVDQIKANLDSATATQICKSRSLSDLAGFEKRLSKIANYKVKFLVSDSSDNLWVSIAKGQNIICADSLDSESLQLLAGPDVCGPKRLFEIYKNIYLYNPPYGDCFGEE